MHASAHKVKSTPSAARRLGIPERRQSWMSQLSKLLASCSPEALGRAWGAEQGRNLAKCCLQRKLRLVPPHVGSLPVPKQVQNEARTLLAGSRGKCSPLTRFVLALLWGQPWGQPAGACLRREASKARFVRRGGWMGWIAAYTERRGGEAGAVALRQCQLHVSLKDISNGHLSGCRRAKGPGRMMGVIQGRI